MWAFLAIYLIYNKVEIVFRKSLFAYFLKKQKGCRFRASFLSLNCYNLLSIQYRILNIIPILLVFCKTRSHKFIVFLFYLF